MNLAGIGRGATTDAQGKPELLKAAASSAQQMQKADTANKIKKISIKVKMKGK